MRLLRHKHDDDGGEAHALRRYVAARAAGRTAPEYAQADSQMLPGATVWTACAEADANSHTGFRRLRPSGMPWCPYLGKDTRIASDIALAAFFELHATEPHDWTRLLKEVTRHRRKALPTWRARGREILVRQRLQREAAAADATPPAPLVLEFKQRGTGVRSLKKVKRGGR